MEKRKDIKSKKKIDLVPLKSLDLSQINDFDGLARAMNYTAFGGRQIGEATDVVEAMVVDKDCFKILTLSGAMTMAKMGLVICDMIDNNLVDAIISTGALMSHGFIESVGMSHFKAPDNIGDEELYEMNLNRVYDTLEPEENFDGMDDIVEDVFEKIDAAKPTCSYKICRELGKYLSENVKGRAILKSAYNRNVPVFIPAFTDSEMGLDFAIYNRKMEIENRQPLSYDPFLDLNHYAELVIKAKKTGILTIGGGVPRNWAQQIAVYLDLIKRRVIKKERASINDYGASDPYIKPLWYAVRICPEPVHWGGLSGCTYSESVSWGKIVPKSEGGKYAEVLCDATIAWPIIIKAVLQRLEKSNKKI